MKPYNNEIARKIISGNIYMTIATTDKKGNVWAAPLFYAIDHEFNFYFISQLNTLHIQHIMENSTVAFAIFDSQQKEGTGNGVQGSGKVHLLDDSQLSEAFKWYKTTFIEMKPESFMGNAPYRFFRLVPEHFYIQDPDARVDKRIEIFLNRHED